MRGYARGVRALFLYKTTVSLDCRVRVCYTHGEVSTMDKSIDLDIGEIQIIAEKSECEPFHFHCTDREMDGFVHFKHGTGQYRTAGGRTYPVCEGATFFLRKGDSYTFSVEAGCCYVTSAFCISRDASCALSEMPPVCYRGELGGAITRLAQEWATHRAGSYMRCKLGILSLYTELLEGEPLVEDSAVLRALEFVHNNFRRPFSGAEVAAYCSLSPSHLRHKFHVAMGVSITEYRDTLRIAAAREMLASRVFSPKEAAYALGYADVYHFSKAFAAAVGVTPARYARGVREPCERKSK